TRIPRQFGLDPIRDIQVLCPMNRGGVGARSLNIELQAALNPAGEHKVERFGWTFAPGDKVMQIFCSGLYSVTRGKGAAHSDRAAATTSSDDTTGSRAIRTTVRGILRPRACQTARIACSIVTASWPGMYGRSASTPSASISIGARTGVVGG